MPRRLRKSKRKVSKRFAKSRGTKSAGIHRRLLCCEVLEDRALLSVDAQFYHVLFDPVTNSMCSATSTALNDGQEVSPMAGSSAPVGLTPQAIRAAYGIDQITGDGTGQTIAIVDAYDN
ncbi:MAG: hypothetical protein ABFD16_09560, partial [Thermoguttaceae bacterium]